MLSKTLALVPPTIALMSQHSSGAMSGYLKIGDIKGESTESKHTDWIDIQSVQWGVGRAISSPAGGGSREASAPSISEITITKRVDASSPAIFLNAVGGSDPVATVTLELTTSTGSGPVVFYRLTLSDVYVTGQSHSAGMDGSEISESISLNFSKIKMEYYKVDSKGGAVLISPINYDLATGKSS